MISFVSCFNGPGILVAGGCCSSALTTTGGSSVALGTGATGATLAGLLAVCVGGGRRCGGGGGGGGAGLFFSSLPKGESLKNSPKSDGKLPVKGFSGKKPSLGVRCSGAKSKFLVGVTFFWGMRGTSSS